MKFFSFEEDWTRQVFDLDVPASAFGSFESIVALWRGKCGEDRLPAWKDFDIHELAGWHGWLAVFDVTATKPFDFVGRLWGTRLVELLGHDLTGKSPRRDDLPGGFAGGFTEDDMAFMSRVVDEPCIARTEGAIYWQQRWHVRYADIFLPLAAAGSPADAILCATVKLAD